MKWWNTEESGAQAPGSCYLQKTFAEYGKDCDDGIVMTEDILRKQQCLIQKEFKEIVVCNYK